MRDTNILESTMDGQPFEAGYHAASLRRFLWREHLGLLPAQDLDSANDPNAQPPGDSGNDVREDKEWEFVADPLSDKVWDMWTGNATTNTEMYRQLFRADPDDNSKFWSHVSLIIFSPFAFPTLSAIPPCSRSATWKLGACETWDGERQCKHPISAFPHRMQRMALTSSRMQLHTQ